MSGVAQRVETWSRRLGATLAACVLLGGGRAAADSSPLPKAEPWVEVRTANFTLYGNASESKVREVGLELERLRAALAVLFRSKTVNAPVPTHVFVFRNDASMEPYKPQFGGKPAALSGYFFATRDGNDIAVTASWNTDFRRVVYHEYLHYFLNANYPPRPVWFDEGCAEYYSTFRATEGEAKVGLVVEAHLRRLRDEGLIPVAKLLAVTQSSDDYHEASRQGVFYAESWALVHYLARGAPQRAGQLDRYLALLARGREPAAAFREAFDTDPDELTAELRRYVDGGSFRYVSIKSAELKFPAAASATPMRRPDVLARLGGLLGRLTEERSADAEAHLRAALTEDPADALAFSELGALKLRQRKPAEARAFLEKANAASPDPIALFHEAEARLACAGYDGSAPPAPEDERRAAVEAARTALRSAIARDPSFAEALVLFGRTFLLGPGNPDEGIEALRAAMNLLPSRRELRRDLASLYDRKGESAKAAELLRSSGPGAEALLEKREKNAAFAAALAEVNALLADKRDEDALARMEAMRTSAAGTEAALLDEALAKLREGVARNRDVRAYNDAVALANKGQTEAALKAFEALGRSASSPELAAAAREKAEMLRAARPHPSRKK